MVFISHSKVVISISIDIIATTWTFLDSTCLLSTESETPPTLWVEPNGMCFHKFSRWFPCMLKFCKHSWKYAKILCNRIQLFTTPWTVAHQAPLSVGFSKQEYWSGLPCPPPADLPDSWIKPWSHRSPALASRFFTTDATREAQKYSRRNY